jgi:hypothetical protein
LHTPLKAKLAAVEAGMEAAVDVSIIFNLSTLYELQSSTATANKQKLVPKVVANATDEFDVESLKLQ